MPPTFSKNFANFSSAEKQTEQKQKTTTHTNRGKGDARYLISIIICVLAVLLAGLSYGANIYLDRQILSVGNSIESQEESIQLEVIHDLITFDQQIRTLKDLSALRGGYLPILREMSAIVIDGVQYTQAEISLNENREYEVRADGSAESLEAYLRQRKVVDQVAQSDSDRFAKLMNLDEYTIRRDRDGVNSVLFTLKMSIPIDEFIPASLKDTETL